MRLEEDRPGETIFGEVFDVKEHGLFLARLEELITHSVELTG